jgi:hypothetical protein
VEGIKVSDFFDEFGLLHVEPNQDSENGILFAAHWYTLRVIRGVVKPFYWDAIQEVATYTEEGDRLFNANPKNDVSRFSHDNMTGLYCLLFQFGYWKWVDKLPVIKWNCNRRNPPTMEGYWLHPRDILFYLSLKFPYTLGTILFPLLLPFLLVSIMARREVTSGKCLWFTRLSSVSNTKTSIGFIAAAMLGLATFVLSMKGENWKDIFAFYFKNPEHPINQEFNLLWEELDD